MNTLNLFLFIANTIVLYVYDVISGWGNTLLVNYVNNSHLSCVNESKHLIECHLSVQKAKCYVCNRCEYN